MGRRAMPGSDAARTAIAANGEDVQQQVEALEKELRTVHGHLDVVLTAIESLLRSPAMTPQLESCLREVLEPATRAIASGAGRLQDQVCLSRAASGW